MRQMKDSGVEWIGAIPIDWKIIKLKYLISIHSGESISNEQLIEDGAYEVYGGGEAIGLCNTFNTKASDILVGRVGARCGCVSYPQNNVWATDNALVISSNCNPTFLYYMLDSMKLNRLNTSNAQPLITGAKIKNSFIPFIFDKNEQTRIIDFLDNKCAQIDSIIDDIYHQIVILQEYKQSVITEAVTKGLNKNVAMKDSGFDFINNIPADWSILKTRYCLAMSITDGPHTTPQLFDEGIPFVSAEAVSSGNGKIDFSHIRGYISEEFYQECCKKYKPQRDDIYIIKSGATTGRVAIVDTDEIFTIWSPLAVYRCNTDKCLPKYMFYYVQSSLYQKQIELGWNYGTQQNIGMSVLEKLKVILPPLKEQEQIATYLESKCTTINLMLEDKQKQLDTLTEYKKSLIYEYVTGKKEVPADA